MNGPYRKIPQLQLRYKTLEEARAAQEAVSLLLRLLAADNDLFVKKLPTVVQSIDHDVWNTVIAEFLAWPAIDRAPTRMMLPPESELHAGEPQARHVMIDLETLGRRPGCRVLSIGAREFCPHGLIGEPFYEVLRHEEQSMLAVDHETAKWWGEQSSVVRDELFISPVEVRTPSGLAAQRFSDWLSERGHDVRVWGNGKDFDPPVLEALYCTQLGWDKAPWEFWNTRCYRDMKSQYRGVPKPKSSGRKHHALDDAEFQAEHLVSILNAARLWDRV